VSRALADTSVFIEREAGRPLGELPEEVAVSVVHHRGARAGSPARPQHNGAGPPAGDAGPRARVLSAVQIDGAIASSFARLAAEQLGAGGKVRGHDTWIAATALHLGVPVLSQDDDFTRFDSVEVIVL